MVLRMWQNLYSYWTDPLHNYAENLGQVIINTSSQIKTFMSFPSGRMEAFGFFQPEQYQIQRYMY